MYFDCRDVAANKSKSYKSYDSSAKTITIEISCDEDCDEYFKENLSKEAFELMDEEGCITLPMKFEVCPLCGGTGKHVNPSIDAHGISAEEWDRDWSYEDREMYMNGGYDVVCYECGGRNVVPAIDEDHLSKPQKEWLEEIEKQQREEAEYAHMCLMERRMGA